MIQMSAVQKLYFWICNYLCPCVSPPSACGQRLLIISVFQGLALYLTQFLRVDGSGLY